MKNIYYGLSLLILIAISSCSSSRVYNQDDYDRNQYSQDYQQDGPITYQQFYDDLGPYGNWVNYQNYGYVWVPNVPGFRPYYTAGQWAYTQYGWTWVSDYNWGWAPFHYGRWMRDMAFGWVWVPGYEWGPAWVSWRGGGDYYGWAPMGPGGNMMGNIPYDNWTFVPGRYINSPRINNYYINRSRNVTIINNTTIINHNTTFNNGARPAYNAGPSVIDVERSTRTRIRQLNIENANRPGATQRDNNSIRVYRPTVKADPVNNRSAMPARVFTTRELEANRPTDGNRPANNQRPVTPNVNRGNVTTPQLAQPDNRNRPQRQLPNSGTQTPQPDTRNVTPGNVPPSRPARTFNNENTRQTPPANNNQPAPEPVKPMIKNEPSRNLPERQPLRQMNTEQRPEINRNTPPANAPARQPVRSFNIGENSGTIRQSRPEVTPAPSTNTDRSSNDRPAVRRTIPTDQ